MMRIRLVAAEPKQNSNIELVARISEALSLADHITFTYTKLERPDSVIVVATNSRAYPVEAWNTTDWSRALHRTLFPILDVIHKVELPTLVVFPAPANSGFDSDVAVWQYWVVRGALRELERGNMCELILDMDKNDVVEKTLAWAEALEAELNG